MKDSRQDHGAAPPNPSQGVFFHVVGLRHVKLAPTLDPEVVRNSKPEHRDFAHVPGSFYAYW